MKHYVGKFYPSQGRVCVTVPVGRGLKHFWFPDAASAYNHALFLDTTEPTVYISQGSFHTNSRTQDQCAYMRSFFLDIDCGEGKPFPDQKAGAQALGKFLAATDLPKPSVLNSGNGLYAIWALTDDVLPDVWKAAALTLKRLTVAAGFDADHVVTADQARTLRPLGCTNRKDLNNPKRVRFVRESDAVDLQEFLTALGAAAKRYDVRTPTQNAPKTDLNSVFQVYQDVPSSIEKIRLQCGQFDAYYRAQAQVPEPLWHAVIKVALKCTEGVEGLAEWGLPEQVQETIQKGRVASRYDVGPTTCEHFNTLNPAGCVGCKHRNKITSPIQLGRDIKTLPDKPAPIDLGGGDLKADPPACFFRKENGIYFAPDAEDSGEVIKFYDRDIYPVRLQFDTVAGHEVVVARHHLPHDVVDEFTFRSALLCDPKNFQMMLRDNQVHILGKKEKILMEQYFEGFVKNLQTARRTHKLYAQMGWQQDGDDLRFVFGEQVIDKDGTISPAGLSKAVPSFVESYRVEGDLQRWSRVVEVLQDTDLMPYLFAFCAGLGAPLMHYTGFEGALVALVGASGMGKTLISKAVQSIYGHPATLMNTMKDTRNMLFSRLGVMNSLPMTIDELSNYDAQDLSDFLYQITQGKDKGRLTERAVEKKNILSWRTLVITSSNHSFSQKLAQLKADASAELMRVFEVLVDRPIPQHYAVEIARTIEDNYGLIGEPYLRLLTVKQDEHKAALHKIMEAVEKAAGCEPEERFWVAVVAVSLYGAMLFNKVSQTKINTLGLYDWVIAHLQTMRKQRTESVTDMIDLLAQFIDEHASNRLSIELPSVDGDITSRKPIGNPSLPKSALLMRYEMPNRRLWVDRRALRSWLSKRFIDARMFEHTLQVDGALIRECQKVLGAHTSLTGRQVRCYEFDVEECGAQVVRDIENPLPIGHNVVKGVK